MLFSFSLSRFLFFPCFIFSFSLSFLPLSYCPSLSSTGALKLAQSKRKIIKPIGRLRSLLDAYQRARGQDLLQA
jgi:hypothetical protein